MNFQPYEPNELEWAYCHRVYLRWKTHRNQRQPVLAGLTRETLVEIGGRFDINILESASSESDVLVLASLKPQESVSSCASKLKGQVSKWLRTELALDKDANLLAKSYFACTAGKSTTEVVNRYLASQGEHHGFGQHQDAPLFIREYDLSAEDEQRLKAAHAVTRLNYHIVMATTDRKGVFDHDSGVEIADHWSELLRKSRAALMNVSFVPDHVHLALRAHPAVAPNDLVLALMNSAQEIMSNRFPGSIVNANIERLWQPSAYLGSYGDFASTRLATYIRRLGAEAL